MSTGHSPTLLAEPLVLKLKTPFRIAHGTSTERRNILVRLGDSLGEGALPPYYDVDMDQVMAYFDDLDVGALLGDETAALEDRLDRMPPGPAPARAALDIALHDYWGRSLGLPLYQLWGLNPARAPVSSITISIPETLQALSAQVKAYSSYPVLKLKLGTGDLDRDEAIVRTAFACTKSRLCVDANSAWPIREAFDMILRLVPYNLLFIEQPLPADDPDDWHRLARLLPEEGPPLIADESIQTADDILGLAGAADGVNIKLTKAGGLRPARHMIALARALDMQVMLGCMVESAVALTAAAHLAPLVDYADLDGILLVADTPFTGMTLDNGRIVLPDAPGLGVRPITPPNA